MTDCAETAAPDKRQQVLSAKSAEMRRRVLMAGNELMQEAGLAAVQIRAVAQYANCSIGTVYKHFYDNDALIVAVNSLTLDAMREEMKATAAQHEDPLQRLKELARTYLRFAENNRNAWEGLFSHHLTDGGIPDEHRQQNVDLLNLIAVALGDLNPGLDDVALASRTRTCFASMHGLVTISIENRYVAVGEDDLEGEMDFVVERLCSPT